MLGGARIPGLLPLAGVAGFPVAHSLSPVMMTAWLQADARPGRYVAFEIAPDRFADAIRALPALGIRGLNLTMPHKQAGFALADILRPAARALGAANLLLVGADASLTADNTDVVGVASALAEGEADPDLGPAVILGAGGAARAALYVLQAQGYRTIRLVNRSVPRARALLEASACEGEVFGIEQTRRALEGAGLLINATSLGMTGQAELDIELSPLHPAALVFDMVYAPLRTSLLRAARASGLRSVDGLSMLIGQARPSFEAFFGAPPPSEVPIRDILIAALEAKS